MLRQCRYDNVTVHDGIYKDSDVLLTHCGVGIPDTIMSSSNSLRMYFTTDDAVQRTGFVAKYTVAKPECELRIHSYFFNYDYTTLRP